LRLGPARTTSSGTTTRRPVSATPQRPRRCQDRCWRKDFRCRRWAARLCASVTRDKQRRDRCSAKRRKSEILFASTDLDIDAAFAELQKRVAAFVVPTTWSSLAARRNPHAGRAPSAARDLCQSRVGRCRRADELRAPLNNGPARSAFIPGASQGRETSDLPVRGRLGSNSSSTATAGRSASRSRRRSSTADEVIE